MARLASSSPAYAAPPEALEVHDAQLLVEVLEGMSAQLELQNSELSAHNELLKRQIGVLSNGRGRSATASPAPSAFSSS